MSATPSDSSAMSWRGQGGQGPPGMTEMLAREGAPWRPFKDAGVLLKPQETPRDAKTIFAASEKSLVAHLAAVCSWPEQGRNESWRVGDYSFYVLEFAPAPGAGIYVQFWSEPDDGGVLFEVSSGAMNAKAVPYLDAGKQELLRDHGFEIGGNAKNFRKAVAIEKANDLQGLARETVAILAKVLGYDGTCELHYSLQLHTEYVVRHALLSVTPSTFEKLLREWGFRAELKREGNGRVWIEAGCDYGRFCVLFDDETREGSGSYRAAKLRTSRKVAREEAAAVANAFNRDLPGHKVMLDEDGDLVVESDVTLLGGVTPEHLRLRLALWRAVLENIATAGKSRRN